MRVVFRLHIGGINIVSVSCCVDVYQHAGHHCLVYDINKGNVMGCKYLTHGPKAAGRRATSCAGDSPVAGRANIAGSVSKTPGRNRKLSRALERRLADYTRGLLAAAGDRINIVNPESCNTVQGHQSPEQVLAFLNLVASQPQEN